MGFSERLRRLRRERGYSQEALAEALNVSRQAVSKWEQGLGYPEVENLKKLSSIFCISLDELLSEDEDVENRLGETAGFQASHSILIPSFDYGHRVHCCDVMPSKEFRSFFIEPKFALFGITGITPFWGELRALLGWYADEEKLNLEIQAIRDAIRRKCPSYELQYAVKVRWRWGRYKIIREDENGVSQK